MSTPRHPCCCKFPATPSWNVVVSARTRRWPVRHCSRRPAGWRTVAGGCPHADVHTCRQGTLGSLNTPLLGRWPRHWAVLSVVGPPGPAGEEGNRSSSEVCQALGPRRRVVFIPTRATFIQDGSGGLQFVGGSRAPGMLSPWGSFRLAYCRLHRSSFIARRILEDLSHRSVQGPTLEVPAMPYVLCSGGASSCSGSSRPRVWYVPVERVQR